WRGDDNTGTLVDNEREIFGQRLTAAGLEVGANDFRISDVGPDGDTHYGAHDPAGAYNGTGHEDLVVWRGDDNHTTLVDGEIETRGERLNAATGVEVGANDFRLSHMGPDGDTSYGAFHPAVVSNGANSEYLVVWHGDNDHDRPGNEEFEIFGQRFSPLDPPTPPPPPPPQIAPVAF